MTIGLSQAFFHDTDDENKSTQLNQIFGEGSFDDTTPFVLKINTREKVPKGDYTIDMAFTYSADGEMATDYKVVTVHVTDWVEKHTRILTVGSIIGTIIGVVGFLQPLVTDFLSGG